MAIIVDVTGQTFGTWLVLSRNPKVDKKTYISYWNCRCVCGNEAVVSRKTLSNCRPGCFKCASYGRKAAHGLYGTKILGVYTNMVKRCYDATEKGFKSYGARGIRVCKEWLGNPRAFATWAYENGYTCEAGIRNTTHTLDRVDNNGNYCPENCRFTSMVEQANNKRKPGYNVFLTVGGETKRLRVWAEQNGIRYGTLWARLESGMPPYDAAFKPLRNPARLSPVS